MLDRQFSLAVVAIALLLSPNIATANEIGDTDLSVGRIRIQTTKNGTRLQTPNMQIDSAKSIENRVAVSRTRRRMRTAPVRRRSSTSVILNKKVSADSKTTVTTTTSPSGNATIRTTTTTSPNYPSTIRTTTTNDPDPIATIESSPKASIRRTTIRNSSNGSESVSESSTSCRSGSGSTVIQSSSTTVNGRTVSSHSRSNCN